LAQAGRREDHEAAHLGGREACFAVDQAKRLAGPQERLREFEAENTALSGGRAPGQ
jgi:hypothetical protein